MIVLGPMAGVTDLPFRLLCKEQGADMVFTEMVSAKGLTYNNKNTKELLQTDSREFPIALQLFASEPDVIKEAVSMVEQHKFSMIDINMGCPVPKVVKNGEGCALMKTPKLAAEIIKAVKSKTNKKVSVKFRKGFEIDDDLGVDFAKRMEDAGADMITIHGRTRAQGYSGKADWDHIKKVKESVSIPVIGSGDVFSFEDIKKMKNKTHVDGVMIARGAMGNPWIFSGKTPTLKEKYEMILRHAKLLIEYYGELIGMKKMRSHAMWYTKGEKDSTKFRARLSKVERYAELEKIFEKIINVL